MTPQQIKANAPQGATHYIDCGHITYHKYIGSICYEITPFGNEPMHPSWYHQLKPL